MKMIDEIYGEMCGTYYEKTGVALNDGGDMAVRLYASAAQIYAVYTHLEWVRKQCFPQTAAGEALDCHAGMRGLVRTAAVKATGYIRFGVKEARDDDLEIPAGTLCVTAGLTAFKTTGAGLLKAGALYCDAAAEAVEAGESGNVSAGTITYMSVAPVGVSVCTNPERFLGGVEVESDNSLRERVLESYARLPNGANVAFYEKEVMSMANVGAVKVLPRARGIGTVDIVVSSTAGLPPEEMLEEIRARLQEIREICVDIEVLEPVKTPVDVSIELDISSEYTINEVSETLKTALESYFDGGILGEDILMARLGSIIYGVPGVLNYKILSPMGDISTEDSELPSLKSLSITERSGG